MSQHFDVAIIGGGIVGASVAYALRGLRSVVLLEMEEQCGYHATGRSAAELSLRFHSPATAALTRASMEFFTATPEGFSEVELLRRRGNLIIAGRDKVDRLHQVLAYENEANPGAPLHLLDTAALLEHVPFLDPAWLGGGFYDPDCWDVEVANLLEGYLRGARAAGADIRKKSLLIGAERIRGNWLLQTEGGEVTAKTVVNASGAWADAVAQTFQVPPLQLTAFRRTAITVKVPDFDLSALPEVNEVDEDFYFKPDAGHLMVSPADETQSEAGDAWAQEIDIAYAAHYLTECTTLEVTHVAHSWAGLRTFARDRLPVIGFDPRAEDLFWAGGLGGYGIQTSPAVGALAAALLVGDDRAARRIFSSPEAFSPQRLFA